MLKILVIGQQNCNRCVMVKNILDQKEVKYDYKDISEMSTEIMDLYLSQAREKNVSSFPLIIRDDKLITLQEV